MYQLSVHVFYPISSIVALALSLDCDSNQNYLKIIKKTGSWANEESFDIRNGNTALYTSPSLTNNQVRTIETCLTSTTHSIYTLRMKDSAGDGWSNLAYIELYGIHGNMVYKGMMVEKRLEEVQFSLYTPIGYGASWKYTDSASGNWKGASFSDNDWTTVTLGSTTQTASGTQFFRKTFTGVNGMAAIDVQLKYKFGVVAYINGVEIYRDNMPDGTISPSTPSTGSYGSYAYHGVIRSASVAQASSSVLAVELHFSNAESSTIEFNSLLAFFAGISTANNCYVVPTTTTASASGFTGYSSSNDWSRNTGATAQTAPASLTYEFTGASIPMIDAFRIWLYTSNQNTVSDFTIEGATSKTGTYSTLMASSGNVYAGYTWEQFDRLTPADRFKAIRLNALASHSTTMHINELQFLVCNKPTVTTITFKESAYSYYRNSENAYIAPTVFGFTGCTVSPALPAGMSMNAETCIITGTPTEIRATTTYQVSATVQGQTYQGSFSLTVSDCTGTMFMIQRTYITSPETEYFRIRDTSNDDILFEVESGHSHSADKEWTTYLCISVERFDVAFYSTATNWYANSFFYMYYLLPDNEMILKGYYDDCSNH